MAPMVKNLPANTGDIRDMGASFLERTENEMTMLPQIQEAGEPGAGEEGKFSFPHKLCPI